jgi:hypothetical protein
MKIVHLRLMALALAAIVISFVTPGKASAAFVGIQVGTPPPPGPVMVDRPWARPYRGAVWIPAHYQWVRGGWVRVGGYYSYPPRRGQVWIQDRYRHGYYYPGHWARG